MVLIITVSGSIMAVQGLPWQGLAGAIVGRLAGAGGCGLRKSLIVSLSAVGSRWSSCGYLVGCIPREEFTQFSETMCNQGIVNLVLW
jgi:hypothetical protein